MSADADRAQDIAAVPLGDGRFHAQYRIVTTDERGADVLCVRFVRGIDRQPIAFGSVIAAEAAAGRAAFADMRGELRHQPAQGKAVLFKSAGGLRVRLPGTIR